MEIKEGPIPVKKGQVPVVTPFYEEVFFKTIEKALRAVSTLPKDAMTVRWFVDHIDNMVGLGTKNQNDLNGYVKKMRMRGGKLASGE